MREAKVEATCDCNFGFVETGVGTSIGPIDTEVGPDYFEDHKIIQLIGADARLRYSNREIDEEMDDLEMRCIRCGKIARWR